MAAAAQPTGQLIACDVHPGQAAADPLYTPLIARVREILQETGLLYAGDSKMAALETRANLVANKDFYLCPLPLAGGAVVCGLGETRDRGRARRELDLGR